MRDLTFFIAVFVCLLLAACSIEKTETGNLKSNTNTIHINQSDIISNQKLSELIDVDSIIALETSEESIIGEIDKVIVTNHLIYVVDKFKAKGVFCFDKKGKFINAYTNIGRGPNEFERINDISFHNNRLYVLTHPYGLRILNEDLTFSKVVETNWLDNGIEPRFLEVVCDSTMVLFEDVSEYSFCIYNYKSKEVMSRLVPSPRNDWTFPNNPLIKVDDLVFATMNFRDTIYKVLPNSVEPYIIVDFEDALTISEKQQIMKTDWSKRSRPEDKMYNLNNFYETESFVTFSFIYKSRRHFCFVNKKKFDQLTLFANNLQNDLYGSRFFPQYKGFYKNSIIVDIEPHVLLNSHSRLSNVVTNNIDENDNPLLLFFKPKFSMPN